MFYLFCGFSLPHSRYSLLAGGIDTVTKERRWAKIANKLGYPSGRSVGSILKNHYERILYPFDVFKLGKTLSDIVSICSSCKKNLNVQREWLSPQKPSFYLTSYLLQSSFLRN